MARKIFISVLGTGFYEKCKYTRDSVNFKSSETRFVQTSTLEYINAKNWSSNDCAYFVLTDLAKKLNWNHNITERFNRNKNLNEPYLGLEQELINMNLPFPIKEIPIPEGKNEVEMWAIFRSIFVELQSGDELYLDLTHSFRYLPMLLLILCNYAKVVKEDIKVASITYGNYEARNTETNEAPIVNLLPLSSLQDWTFAAADFIENGNVKKLSSLSELEYNSILKDTKGKDENARNLRSFIKSLIDLVSDFQTCRGMNIVNATNISSLKETLEKIQSSTIQPLDPVIDKIKEGIEPFDSNKNVSNGFKAAQWCLNNGLYQQAATILQENVVTFFAQRNGIDIDDSEKRGLINNAFTILSRKYPKEKWDVKEEYIPKVEDIIKDELLQDFDILNAFDNLTNVRNDINHSGMRDSNQMLSANSIRTNITKCVNVFEKKLS